MHHGLEYVVKEYEVAEGEFNRLLTDPGTHEENTFYVTNLREPILRSISGFKCKTNLFLMSTLFRELPLQHISHLIYR